MAVRCAPNTARATTTGPGYDKHAVAALLARDLSDATHRDELQSAVAASPFAEVLTASGTAPRNVRPGSLALQRIVEACARGALRSLAASRSTTASRAALLETLDAEAVDALVAEIGVQEAAWVVLAHPAGKEFAQDILAAVAAEAEGSSPASATESAQPAAGVTSPHEESQIDFQRLLQALGDVKSAVTVSRTNHDALEQKSRAFESDTRRRLNGLEGTVDAHAAVLQDHSAELGQLGQAVIGVRERTEDVEAGMLPAEAIEPLGAELRRVGARVEGVIKELAAVQAQAKLEVAEVRALRVAERLDALESAQAVVPAGHVAAAAAARQQVAPRTSRASTGSDGSAELGWLPERLQVEPIWRRRLGAVGRAAGVAFGGRIPEVVIVDGHNVVNGHVNAGVFETERAGREWITAQLESLSEILGLDRVFLCFDTRHANPQEEPVSDRMRVFFAPKKDGGADALIAHLVEERLQGTDVLVVSTDFQHIWASNEASKADGWNVRSVPGHALFVLLGAVEDATLPPAVPEERVAHALRAASLPKSGPVPARADGPDAKTLLASGDYAAAEAAYTELYNQHPTTHTALVGRARAKALNGDADGALADLALAEGHLPNDPAIAEMRAKILSGESLAPKQQSVAHQAPGVATAPRELTAEERALLHRSGEALADGRIAKARDGYGSLFSQLDPYHGHVNLAMVALAASRSDEAAFEIAAAGKLAGSAWNRQVTVRVLETLCRAIAGQPLEGPLGQARAGSAGFDLEKSPLKFLAAALRRDSATREIADAVFGALTQPLG